MGAYIRRKQTAILVIDIGFITVGCTRGRRTARVTIDKDPPCNLLFTYLLLEIIYFRHPCLRRSPRAITRCVSLAMVYILATAQAYLTRRLPRGTNHKMF